MALIVDQKKLSRQSVFQYIYQAEKPVTKSEISSALKLGFGADARALADLEKEKMIRLVEEKNEKGKSVPVGYIVKPNLGYAVGVAVSAYNLRFCVVNAKMEEIGFKKVPVVSFDSEEIGKQISEILPKFLIENEVNAAKVKGLGISLPGIIDSETNTVVFSPTLKMKNIKLDKMIERIPLDIPIYVENDSTCAGYLEKKPFGEEDSKNSFVYLFLENGVGGAICIEGKPYFGLNHRGGEFGHMKVGNKGYECSCGKKDCLEAYIGSRRFSRNRGIMIEDFFAEVENGNEEYKEMWIEGIEHLAVAVANLRTGFDCEVILGGFMTEYLEPYMDFLREKVLELCPFEENADFLRIGSFARRSAAKGMAKFAMSQFLENI